jgi:hypothetical protein
MDTPVCVFDDRIFVKNNRNSFVKVEIDDIYWIKGGGSYSVFETANGRFTTSHNLKYIENKIKNSRLVRLHRSYIVNLSRVKQISGKNFVILDIVKPDPNDTNGTKSENGIKEEKEIKIPIGPEYRSSISKIINVF